MKKETLQRGLIILSAVFIDKEFNAKVYWELLKDIDDESFIKAIKIFCHTSEDIYPGTNVIAKIRDLALNDNKKDPAMAWLEVMREIRRVGCMGIPIFSDDVVRQAVECIGWRNICLSEKIAVERKHFMDVYPQFMDRQKKNEVKQIGFNREGLNRLKAITNGVL